MTQKQAESENQRKERIKKATIEKMFLRMNIGKQKAFYLMKLRAQEAKYEV